MKVAVIGAAGVRTPQLVKALCKRSNTLGISHISLMDNDGKRLALIESVIREMLAEFAELPRVSTTVDVEDAFANADYVIFTIRVGNGNSRVIDERIPMEYGVLGQETTGPGGFGMAMRTIPVIIDYIKVLEEVSPKAWVINLTNPAGLITQAITDYGYQKVVGICDSPTELFQDIAKAMNLLREELWFEYFGINHLGWIKRILHKGRDITAEVLANDRALLRHGTAMLAPQFIRSLGMIPNEYLMFYYNNQAIIRQVQGNHITRGGAIEGLNEILFHELALLASSGKSGSLEVYKQYSRARNDSYMQVETSPLSCDNLVQTLWKNAAQTESEVSDGPEGYAGIALSVLEALSGVSSRVIVVNATNNGAIDCLERDDVVEVPCYVDINGVHPIAGAKVPEVSRGLLQLVKSYERITIDAIKEGSYNLALQALTVHPLVPDAQVAKAILDAYVHAHNGYFSQLR